MRIVIAIALTALALSFAVAAPAEPDDDATTSTTQWLTYENYDLEPAEARGAGIRAARVTDPRDLPGGPWAVGTVGDYLIENQHVRVIVRGTGSHGVKGTGSTGEVVDITYIDDMWDRFGSLAQFVRAGKALGGIVYDRVEIKKAPGKNAAPSLVAYGQLTGTPGLPAFTVIQPVPNQPIVAVKTYLTNRTGKPMTLHMAAKVDWGGLAVFAGDYGVAPMLQPITVESPWQCGMADDFALGLVRVVRGEDAQVMLNRNESFTPYGTAALDPNQTTEMNMALICTRGGMGPISQFYLKSRDLPVAMIEGTVSEAKTGVMIPNAEIELTRIRRERGEEVSPDAPYPLPAHAIARTDESGRYRIFLKPGKYAMQSRARGRPAMPPMLRLGYEIKPGKGLQRDLKQVMQNMVTVEAVDAKTGEPIPAKIRFLAVPPTKINLGAPWRADGARDSVYLKPGPNRIPITAGTYRCVVSRGPEYDTWQKTVEIDYEHPLSLRAELKHLIETPGWASVALGTATDVSPSSRVSAADLALAAAGEGLDWIVTGDLNRATDLNDAIRKQGLGQHLKASRGVVLSYRNAKLFGDFFVFPLPEGVTEKDLAKLAKPKTTAKDFFEAVRKAYPDAIICVLNVTQPNASYLLFHGADFREGQGPGGKGFSDAFDAIAVYEGKDSQVHDAAWRMWGAMAYDGQPRIPLPVTRTPTLHYDEPGYARIYVAAPKKTDERRMSDGQLTDAIRRGRYYITNGPILDLELNGAWPEREQPTKQEKFNYRYTIKAAPWVKIESVNACRNNRPREMHKLMSAGEIQRYPHSDDTRKRREWNLFMFDRKTGEKIYQDIYFHVIVEGYGLHPVVSQKRATATSVFAITPPVLFDADGDGKYKF